MNHQAVLDAIRVLTTSTDYAERRAAERVICKESVRAEPLRLRKEGK